MPKRKSVKIKRINPEFRKSVSESFNIYLGTVAMISIFLGFVFLGLLQLLTDDRLINTLAIYEIRLLTVALLALSFALFCFHATAHRCVKYWGIFYPISIYNRFGGYLFLIGILTMFWCVSLLLWNKGMLLEALVVAVLAVGLITFGIYFRRMHGDASYMTRVD